MFFQDNSGNSTIFVKGKGLDHKRSQVQSPLQEDLTFYFAKFNLSSIPYFCVG